MKRGDSSRVTFPCLFLFLMRSMCSRPYLKYFFVFCFVLYNHPGGQPPALRATPFVREGGIGTVPVSRNESGMSFNPLLSLWVIVDIFRLERQFIADGICVNHKVFQAWAYFGIGFNSANHLLRQSG